MLLDTRKACSFADYFVICSGDSTRQIKAIYDEVGHALKKEGKIRVGWGEFIKLGGLIMLVQVAGAIVYLLLLKTLELFPDIPDLPSP